MKRKKQKYVEVSLAKIIIYIIIVFLLVILLLMAFFPKKILGGFGSIGPVKSGEDKCKPERGYTEESWREHMGHHPDIYKECLS